MELKTDYGGYSGYFADLDGYPWEVVVAPISRSEMIAASNCRIEASQGAQLIVC